MRLAVYDTNALIQSPPPTVTTPTFTLEKGDLGYPVYRTAGRYASAARAFISAGPLSSRRGEALWERVEAGSGLLGAASSESAAGSGRLRACGC